MRYLISLYTTTVALFKENIPSIDDFSHRDEANALSAGTYRITTHLKKKEEKERIRPGRNMGRSLGRCLATQVITGISVTRSGHLCLVTETGEYLIRFLKLIVLAND